MEIPNYRVLEKLGVGAQSHIYRARCMRTGKDYAVKVVKIKSPEDATFVDLLKAEHAIGSAVDHPVVRKVYELRIMRQRFRVRGAILFMEFVDGIAMSDKDFNRPLDEVLVLFREVAEGLHAMHLSGYVHADMKPNNIMVTPEGKAKLIDLGQSAPSYQAKARVQGTVDYMAPEQVQRGELNARTDVFGFGATLHRVLTGKPIPTEMNQSVSMHSQNLVGKRVSELRAQHETAADHLPICIVRLMAACCQKNQEDRLTDMGTVIERLDLARAILANRASGSSSNYLDEDDDEEDFDETNDATDHIDIPIDPQAGSDVDSD